jgi:hypothetical protein
LEGRRLAQTSILASRHCLHRKNIAIMSADAGSETRRIISAMTIAITLILAYDQRMPVRPQSEIAKKKLYRVPPNLLVNSSGYVNALPIFQLTQEAFSSTTGS